MSHAGRLLVATPLIGDPNFERTVLLLLAHGVDGAFGVVLNRPSPAEVREVAPEWAPHVAAPAVVFVGGPVGSDSVIGLARGCGVDAGRVAVVVGDIGTVDLHHPPDVDDDHHWDALRLFAGSAGWSAGQLEDELMEGAWWAVDAQPDDLFTTDPSTLWSRVLRRQRGQVAWFANHPPDPTAN